MKILITGGLGLIAKEGLVSFLEDDYQLRLSHHQEPKEECKYEFVKVDVRNYEEVEKAVEGIDVVLHLAAKGAKDPLGVKPKEAFSVNIMGTLNLVEAAKKCGVKKFIYASSIWIYGLPAEGTLPEYLPIDEEHPLKAQRAYGLSKVLAEDGLRGYSRECNFPIISFRIGEVMRKNHGYGLKLAQLKKDAGSGRGSFWNYIDVRDVGEAIKLAIQSDLTGYEAFNLTAEDHLLSQQDNSTLIRKYFPQIKKVYNKNGFLIQGNKSFFDISRIKKRLGFKPKFTLKRYLDWINSGEKEEDYYSLRE